MDTLNIVPLSPEEQRQIEAGGHRMQDFFCEVGQRLQSAWDNLCEGIKEGWDYMTD